MRASSTVSSSTISPRPAGSPLWLRIGFWACIVIAFAVVVRRLVALANPSQSAPPMVAALDAAFTGRTLLTVAHIVPAIALVLLLPFYFFGSARTSARVRWLIFPLGAVVGITAYAMSLHPVGGVVELSATLFFDSLYLFSLVMAFWHARREKSASDAAAVTRQWMLRALVILLGIATTRPVMGVFFATATLTHLAPAQFFGIAFWIGFSINTLIAEWWIRTRYRAAAARPAKNRGLLTPSGQA